MGEMRIIRLVCMYVCVRVRVCVIYLGNIPYMTTLNNNCIICITKRNEIVKL